jgi:hypothetical protein
MEEQFDEDLKDYRKTKVIGTNQTIVSEEPSKNLMSQ